MRTHSKVVAALLLATLSWVAAGGAAFAQLGPSLDIGRRHLLLPSGGAAVVAATVWDSTHCSPNYVLSNSNTTLTRNVAGSSNDYCFTVSPAAAGQKVYVETTWTAFTFTLTGIFGVVNTDTTRFAGGQVSPSTGAAAAGNSTLIDVDSIDSGTAILPTNVLPGDMVDWAFDTGSHRIWGRLNNGPWTGGGDPALGTGGLQIVTTPNILYYFFAGADGTLNDSITARFATGSWIHTPPAGYSQIDGP